MRTLPALLALPLFALPLAAGCAPTVDEDGFTLDVSEAIAARGHELACFEGETVYSLQLAVDGEGDDAENVAALIQDGPDNFVTGTWDYELGLTGDETLSVEVGELAFESTALEKKFGALVSFPADGAECRIRGFLQSQGSFAGTYVCDDDFWDTVAYTFAEDGSLAVRSERDDDGNLTDQDDYGAYFVEGGELFLLRPERTEPEVRFLRGAPGDGAVEIDGRSCTRDGP